MSGFLLFVGKITAASLASAGKGWRGCCRAWPPHKTRRKACIDDIDMALLAGFSTTAPGKRPKSMPSMVFRQESRILTAEKIGAGHARRRTEEDNIASIPDFFNSRDLRGPGRIDPIDTRPRAHH